MRILTQAVGKSTIALLAVVVIFRVLLFSHSKPEHCPKRQGQFVQCSRHDSVSGNKCDNPNLRQSLFQCDLNPSGADSKRQIDNCNSQLNKTFWLPMATCLLLFLSASLLAVTFTIPTAHAFISDQPASLVLGQSSIWNANACLKWPTGFCGVQGIAFDPSGNLWVSSYAAQKVMEFTRPLYMGEAPSHFVGQSAFNFTSSQTNRALGNPVAIAFDSSGSLWVADFTLNRVVEFSRSSLASDSPAAELVIGQANFSGHDPSLTRTGLFRPVGLAFDAAGNLWVADSGNNRVLEYPKDSLTSNDPPAAVVIGQSNFTVSSPTVLSSPSSISFEASGNLWVADSGHHRILEFKAPLTTGESPSLEIGQPSWTSYSPGLTETKLCYPDGVAFDAVGNLWVADECNRRVLEYTKASLIANGSAASLVIGQSSYTSSSMATTQATISYPASLTFDSSSNLWVDERDDRSDLWLGRLSLREIRSDPEPITP